MNLEDLKEALTQLAKEQPEFIAGLIEETICNRVRIAEVSDGDFYTPRTTYALQWYDPDCGFTEFSKAY